jgi:hypothetical protein
MSWQTTLVTALLCLFFFWVGIEWLLWPEKIREWALKQDEDAPDLAKWNPLENWMRTPAYITTLRIGGALSIAGGCLLLFVIIKAHLIP